MAQLPPMDVYGALLFQVTGQQLSVAATRRTLARIEALFGGHLPAPPTCTGTLRPVPECWRFRHPATAATAGAGLPHDHRHRS
jgi:3-methyladenine DNA glycosylase/8-oxoguanine DNA glycosylase